MLVKNLSRKRLTIGISSLRMMHQREWTALLATFFSMFNKVISLVAVFFYVRWTLPYLGKERFGIWMTMSAIITFVSIFSDFGLGSSLVNAVASSSSKDRNKITAYTSSTFFFLLATALSIGVIVFFSNEYLVRALINGSEESKNLVEVRNSLYVLFAIFLLGLPFITVDRTLEGLQLSYISSIWATAGNILSLFATFFFTQHSLGIVWLVVGTLGVQSAFRIVYFFVEFHGRLRIYRPSISQTTVNKVSELLKHGLLFFTLNIFNVLAFQVDNIFISNKLGVAEVPVFSLMQKLITISLFFWFYTISLWPAFAEAHAKRDKIWIKKTVNFIFRLNLLLGLLFGLVIIFFGNTLLSFWSKNAIAAPSFTMKLGFALYILLNGLIGTVAIVFNTGPLLKKHVLGFCMASVATLILKFTFIKQLGVDYIIYMSFAPFLLLYLFPCYLKYRSYVNS
jgi:O-antigen/teichoic acid export membrane protein